MVPHVICNQNPAYAGNLAVLDEAALFAHSHQSTDVVEQIHKQECEQDFD
jgi:hypothetical protein